MVVLMLFSLALPFNMNFVAAATQNQSQITDQSSTIYLTNNETNQTVQQQTVQTQSNEKRNLNEQSTSLPENSPATVTGNTPANVSNTGLKPMAAGSNATALLNSNAAVSFTSSDLNTAASSVKNFVETNHRLPNYVTIAGQQVTVSQFLDLLCQGVLNMNKGLSSSVMLKTVGDSPSPSETVSSGNLQKTEFVQIAQNLENFINANGRLPNYVSSSLGKFRTESLVYMYSKIVNFYSTNQRLPTYVAVTSWASVAGTQSGNQSGTITDPSLLPYLMATKNCQSTSATIIARANSITVGATSTYDKAAAIFNWVRDHTAYSYYENTVKGALGTLSSGSGNCCDHSHLVIALARAAGIPGRYVHVYNHVYAQLYVNGVWYNADAISNSNYFGQPKSGTILGIYAELPF